MSFRNPKSRRKSRRVAKLRKEGKAINQIANLAPDVAAKLLMRTFIYPQRSVASDAAAEVLSEAESLRMDFGRTRLQVYRWHGDGTAPTVALFHDWEQESGYFADYVAPLVDKGCTVLAMDAPASGHSGGKRLSLREYINAIHSFRQNFGPFQTAVAHGLGGSALVQALAQQQPRLRPERVALLGVNANSRAVFERRLAGLGIDELVRMKFWRKLDKTRDIPLGLYDNTLAVKRLSDVEGCIIHDVADARYPVEEAEAVHAAWEGSSLTTLEGFGHALSGKDVIARVLPFVSARKLAGDAYTDVANAARALAA